MKADTIKRVLQDQAPLEPDAAFADDLERQLRADAAAAAAARRDLAAAAATVEPAPLVPYAVRRDSRWPLVFIAIVVTALGVAVLRVASEHVGNPPAPKPRATATGYSVHGAILTNGKTLFRYDGTVDPTSGAAKLHETTGGGTVPDVVIARGHVYAPAAEWETGAAATIRQRALLSDKHWVDIAGGPLANQPVGASIAGLESGSPFAGRWDALALLRAAGTTPSIIGKVKIRGTTTTHYRVVLGATVDVWIDQSGRLDRLGVMENGGIELVVEYYGFGQTQRVGAHSPHDAIADSLLLGTQLPSSTTTTTAKP